MARLMQAKAAGLAALFLLAAVPTAAQVPAGTLTIRVFVAATDTTDASDTTVVRIPITVTAARPPVLAFPSEADTLRAGEILRVPLRDYLAVGDAPVDSLGLVGASPSGSAILQDTLVWTVPDTSRGTQTFEVVAVDTLGNSGVDTLAAFVWYQPPPPGLRFSEGYAEGDTLRLVAGKTDSLVIELEGVDPRDRSLIRVAQDTTPDYVTADTVSGADPPAIKIRLAPSEADTTAGPQSLLIEYDGEQGLLAFF